MKLGIVVFANHSGLGAQTRRLTYMLNPDRILAIDSSGFSPNKSQHFDWYSKYTGYKVDGFPTNYEVSVFLKGLTHVLVCENPLNYSLLSQAKRTGIKVFIQSNYEFCDHLDKNLELPYKFLMPSYWKLSTMKEKFGDNLVEYLPPPIDPSEFEQARKVNMARNDVKRFLHIVGTLAANDRNGTLDLIRSLEYSKENFELVIKAQRSLPDNYKTNDPRVRFDYSDVIDQQDLYTNFDAMILPRRYGGLSLTTNEALMSGLPVIMPNISPNNELLPKSWLVPARRTGSFRTRTMIDLYETDAKSLAKNIDYLAQTDVIHLRKSVAYDLAVNNFSFDVLLPKYREIMEL